MASSDHELLVMKRIEVREIFMITNPNKGWVVTKLDELLSV